MLTVQVYSAQYGRRTRILSVLCTLHECVQVLSNSFRHLNAECCEHEYEYSGRVSSSMKQTIEAQALKRFESTSHMAFAYLLRAAGTPDW